MGTRPPSSNELCKPYKGSVGTGNRRFSSIFCCGNFPPIFELCSTPSRDSLNHHPALVGPVAPPVGNPGPRVRVSLNPQPSLVRPLFRPAGHPGHPGHPGAPVPLNPRPFLADPPSRPAAAASPPLRPELVTSTTLGQSRRRRSRSMTSSPRALLEEYRMRWTCKVTSS